jgi:sugar lactone lactonase YvrE
MRRTLLLGGLAFAIALPAVSTATATAAAGPEVISLPRGFFPEGITAADRHSAFVGSLGNGAILRVDLRTGGQKTLVAGEPGKVAVGIERDRWNRVWVAGGPDGTVRVYDGATGELAFEPLRLGDGYINDMVITRDGAWITNSFKAEIHHVPLASDGRVGEPRVVPLGGDWAQVGEAGTFNANGVVAAPDGRLIVAQSHAVSPDSYRSKLHLVDPETGVTEEISLDHEVTTADGLVLKGRTLYVVQPALNSIAAVKLADDFRSGTLRKTITDEDFRIPTSAESVGPSLWAVNTRFDVPPGPDVEYEIVSVKR